MSKKIWKKLQYFISVHREFRIKSYWNKEYLWLYSCWLFMACNLPHSSNCSLSWLGCFYLIIIIQKQFILSIISFSNLGYWPCKPNYKSKFYYWGYCQLNIKDFYSWIYCLKKFIFYVLRLKKKMFYLIWKYKFKKKKKNSNCQKDYTED